MEFTASSIMRTKLVTCNATESLKNVVKKMYDEFKAKQEKTPEKKESKTAKK